MDMFKACNLAFKHDVQTARFLLPYIAQNAVACGPDAALEAVKAEMELVLQRGPATREGELCVQEVHPRKTPAVMSAGPDSRPVSEFPGLPSGRGVQQTLPASCL